ncbi:MAG TPA: serine hydrolase domain-containing protein [Thermoanaerobaculia bacterium]|nr:serine hydrolase domain-containing protein [Thermoanaerobaculia bacterium]
MSRFAAFAVATLLAGVPVHAEDKSADIDRMFSWANSATPGCSVAVAQHGKVIVNRAYGLADLERDVPLGAHSVFDAGSITKQFVAAAVLLLVDEGRLSLSEDVRKHVPELPDYGHKITIDHLLTHTSGIRDWTGIQPFSTGDPDALAITLRQRGLNFAPGEEWSYSNGGYVLLKEIVARISGMSFSAFARERLFAPLGMKNTAYTLDLREVVRNRALAYEKEDGRWKMDMLLDNDRGGGGALLTTTGDLLLWNEALTSGRLGAFVTEKLQERATLSNGRKLGYARGLYVDTNYAGTVVWHTGGAAGYKSFLGRYPEHALSIAILCNAGEQADRVAFARRILELYVPAGAASVATTETDATPPETELSGRTGLFFNERTGEPLRLIVDGGRLRMAGGPPLVTVTSDRFKNPRGALSFLSQDEFELHFLSNDRFALKSIEGKTTHYRRARSYVPSPADLKAFAGRYQSDELGTVVQVSAWPNGLAFAPEHLPARRMELKPVDHDTFQRGPFLVRFRRDKNGAVVGLDYSNPLLRNVPLTRLIDESKRSAR